MLLSEALSCKCACVGSALAFPEIVTATVQGSHTDALIATVVVGLCNHVSTYASFFLVTSKPVALECQM